VGLVELRHGDDRGGDGWGVNARHELVLEHPHGPSLGRVVLVVHLAKLLGDPLAVTVESDINEA
jgi:hypothetical protein